MFLRTAHIARRNVATADTTLTAKLFFTPVSARRRQSQLEFCRYRTNYFGLWQPVRSHCNEFNFTFGNLTG